MSRLHDYWYLDTDALAHFHRRQSVANLLQITVEKELCSMKMLW